MGTRLLAGNRMQERRVVLRDGLAFVGRDLLFIWPEGVSDRCTSGSRIEE